MQRSGSPRNITRPGLAWSWRGPGPFRNSLQDLPDELLIMADFDQIIVGEEWENTDVSLLETLDHVLNRGLVIAGEITISVADIDLIFIGLNVMVSSVETAREVLRKREME